jgi:hypothetical protein
MKIPIKLFIYYMYEYFNRKFCKCLNVILKITNIFLSSAICRQHQIRPEFKARKLTITNNCYLYLETELHIG